MKVNLLLLTVPMLYLTACSQGDNAASGDAADAGSPYLAKKVVGVSMLTADTDYEKPCDMLGEEFVRSAFNVGEETEIVELDSPDGCTFEWGDNKVSMAFGGTKPYPSIYYAEHIFNKMYQGKAAPKPMIEITSDSALSGPAPAGTGAEGVVKKPVAAAPAGDGEAEATETDSAGSASSATTKLTSPPVSTSRFIAVPGIGDKAVWEPAKGAMHVLYNNHIITVIVETKDRPAVREERAKSMAEVLADKVAEGEYVL